MGIGKQTEMCVIGGPGGLVLVHQPPLHKAFCYSLYTMSESSFFAWFGFFCISSDTFTFTFRCFYPKQLAISTFVRRK